MNKLETKPTTLRYKDILLTFSVEPTGAIICNNLAAIQPVLPQLLTTTITWAKKTGYVTIPLEMVHIEDSLYPLAFLYSALMNEQKDVTIDENDILSIEAMLTCAVNALTS